MFNGVVIYSSNYSFNSFNSVFAAIFPNSLDANGLAPVISFLSTQTVLSDFVFSCCLSVVFELCVLCFVFCFLLFVVGFVVCCVY